MDTTRLEMVGLAGLRVDDAYQRLHNSSKMESAAFRLAQNWNPLYAGVLLISQRPSGHMFIFDGATRWTAAKSLGIKALPAIIYTFATRREEAAAFNAVNRNRIAVTPLERWRAGVVAGDAIDKLTLRLLSDVDRTAGHGSDGKQFGAFTALRKALTDSQEEMVTIWPALHEICTGDKIPSGLVLGAVMLQRAIQSGVGLEASVHRKWLRRLGPSRIMSKSADWAMANKVRFHASALAVAHGLEALANSNPDLTSRSRLSPTW